jgi:hypothetical protein
MWLTAILCAAEDPERVRGWGRRAIAVRLVLLALGQAAMVSRQRRPVQPCRGNGCFPYTGTAAFGGAPAARTQMCT